MNIKQRIASLFAKEEIDPVRIASTFVKHSAWNDIVQKAKRLILSGQVQLKINTPTYVSGIVQGDSGTYEPEFRREDPQAPNALTQSSCTCDWETYRWYRTRQWKKLEGRMCGPGDQTVTMADGTFKRIDEIATGEWVMTHDGGAGQVYGVMERPYSGPMVRISNSGEAESLRLTPGHEVYAYSTPQRFRKDYQEQGGQGFKYWDESFLFQHDPEWTDPETLQRHDWMTTSVRMFTSGQPIDVLSLFTDDEVRDSGLEVRDDDRIYRTYERGVPNTGKREFKRDYQGSIPRWLVPDDDLMLVLGLWLAEGSLKDTSGFPGQLQFGFHRDEETTLALELTKAVVRLGLGETKGYRHKTAKAYNVRLTNHPLAMVVDKLLGRGSNHKKLHPWLMTLSPSSQQVLLDWAWMGDGHLGSGDNRRHYTTSSKHLALQIRDLVMRQGKTPSWQYFEQNGGPSNRELKCDRYTVSWVEDARYCNGRRTVSEHLIATKVTDVQIEHYEGNVYNLHVRDQESYVLNNRVVHNCSHLLALYWKSLATPLDVGDDEDYVHAPGQRRKPLDLMPDAPSPEAPIPDTDQRSFAPDQEIPKPQISEPEMVPGQPGVAPQPIQPLQPMGPQNNPKRPQRKLLDITQQAPILDAQGNPVPGQPGAFSMPDGKPPRPDNIQFPGTLSKVLSPEEFMKIPVRVGFFDMGDGKDDFTNWFNEQTTQGISPSAQLTRDVQLELRGGKIPMPDAQPIGMTEEGIEEYRWQDLGYDPETGERVNAGDRPNGAPEMRGNYATISAGKRCIVMSIEPYTKMAEIMVPLNSSGKLMAHMAKGWVDYSDLVPVDYPGVQDPFVKRKSSVQDFIDQFPDPRV